MHKIVCRICPPWWLKHCFLVVVGALLFAAASQAAETADDRFLRIFNGIMQADSLANSNQVTAAVTKYRDAKSALEKFQQANPGWNPRIVTFRLNYVTDRIATLTAKVSPPAQNAGTDSQTPGVETRSAEPEVKLLEPGAEPRKALRLHPKPGDKQSLALTMKMDMTMSMGGVDNPIKMPGMKLVMDGTVKDVTPEGQIEFETVVREASVSDAPDVMPQVIQAMKGVFAGMKGTTATGTISDRGLNKQKEMAGTAGGDAQARQMMDQFKESFSRASIPLPEEPIGAGARWEVRMPIKSQGMSINQTATYELVSLEGDRMTARNTIKQTAANQKIENPAMPGLKVDLTKMSGSGTGTVTQNLGQVWAEQGDISFHSDVNMAINMGGQKQTTQMKQDLKLQLSSAK